jgi:Flp pilus assembly protein TadB
MRYLIAAAAALAVMAGLSAWQQDKGAQKERVRVHEQGEKAHAKAKTARAKVEQKAAPEIRADLKRYCLDCDAQ